MRPLPRDRQTLRPGRMGPIRVLRLHLVCTLSGLPVAFALTGAKADERTTLLGMLAEDPPPARPTPGADADRGQELLRARLRTRPGPGGPVPAASGPQGRAPPGRRGAVAAVAAGHRVDQSDLQGPVGPGAARRAYSGWGDGAGAPADPGADRRDLAQRPHRPAGPTIVDGLRSLTPWNYSSRARRRGPRGRRLGRPRRTTPSPPSTPRTARSPRRRPGCAAGR